MSAPSLNQRLTYTPVLAHRWGVRKPRPNPPFRAPGAAAGRVCGTAQPCSPLKCETNSFGHEMAFGPSPVPGTQRVKTGPLSLGATEGQDSSEHTECGRYTQQQGELQRRAVESDKDQFHFGEGHWGEKCLQILMTSQTLLSDSESTIHPT